MSTRPQGLGGQREQGAPETIDLAQESNVEVANSMGVKKSDDQDQRSAKSNSRKARLDEARRAAEEYAADLREIIRMLRARLLNCGREGGINDGRAVELGGAVVVAWPRQQ